MLLFLRIEIQTKAEITRPYTVRESRLTKVCRGFVRHTGDRDVRLRLPEALAGLAGQARLQVEVGPRSGSGLLGDLISHLYICTLSVMSE